MFIHRLMDKDGVHVHNRILLNHKRERDWVMCVCSDMDGPRVCHEEWSQKEKHKYRMLMHMYGI